MCRSLRKNWMRRPDVCRPRGINENFENIFEREAVT